jgi:hypothetical protein
VKRPSNSDGDGEAQGFMRRPTSPPSLSPPQGETVIPFPAPPQLPGREGAGVTSASASSFELLGAVTHAVVLRLQGGFPKIKVGRVTEGGGPATRPGIQSAAWEEDER